MTHYVVIEQYRRPDDGLYNKNTIIHKEPWICKRFLKFPEPWKSVRLTFESTEEKFPLLEGKYFQFFRFTSVRQLTN